MCVWRFVLTNILALQLGPPKPKFLAPPLIPFHSFHIGPKQDYLHSIYFKISNQ